MTYAVVYKPTGKAFTRAIRTRTAAERLAGRLNKRPGQARRWKAVKA